MLSTTACSYADIDAGEAGVAVHHPWLFGHGGVSDQVLTTGTELKAWSTEIVKISVTPTAFEVPFDNLMPSNSIPLDFHTVVRLQVTDPVELVKHWNGAAKNEKGEPSDYWFWGTIQPIYVNYVRQEVKKYDMNQLALTGEAVDNVEAAVSKRLEDYIKTNKIPVKLLSVTMGRAGLPEAILAQKVETAAQQQRILTMNAQAQAEDARKASEMHLTPEQFVDLKRIEMQRYACTKGTCIFGNGSALVQR
jgi:regulator of protease activity HflC (stomatin/prohibitin superfamily)